MNQVGGRVQPTKSRNTPSHAQGELDVQKDLSEALIRISVGQTNTDLHQIFTYHNTVLSTKSQY
jgi:hypothetical protein